MILFDVNVLLNAHRAELEHHGRARRLLEAVVNAPEPFALSDLVLSSFVRISTSSRVFPRPTPLDVAFAFAEQLRGRSNARILVAGDRHWPIFEQLCRRSDARGVLVADAYHAALALEHACEWVSFDRDFARFPELRWRHPLD